MHKNAQTCTSVFRALRLFLKFFEKVVFLTTFQTCKNLTENTVDRPLSKNISTHVSRKVFLTQEKNIRNKRKPIQKRNFRVKSQRFWVKKLKKTHYGRSV